MSTHITFPLLHLPPNDNSKTYPSIMIKGNRRKNRCLSTNNLKSDKLKSWPNVWSHMCGWMKNDKKVSHWRRNNHLSTLVLILEYSTKKLYLESLVVHQNLHTLTQLGWQVFLLLLHTYLKEKYIEIRNDSIKGVPCILIDEQ